MPKHHNTPELYNRGREKRTLSMKERRAQVIIKYRATIQLCGKQQKIIYASRDSASDAARELGKLRSPKLRAYRCPIENHWHLTSRTFRPRGQLDGCP